MGVEEFWAFSFLILFWFNGRVFFLINGGINVKEFESHYKYIILRLCKWIDDLSQSYPFIFK